ncbi:MAG: gamma-glutamyltransferase [Pseudomonadota bacterium]
MPRVAVATSSALAADAAGEIAELGGNAVDCALAAALLTANTQPGVCALAGSMYVTVWRRGEAPVTIDGNVAIPGIGRTDAARADAAVPVAMDYGGGITTLVGTGSVAVPGTVAAVDLASQRFGALAFGQLFGPSIRAAKEGFPLPSACHYYLEYSGEPIYGRSRAGYDALFDNDSLRAAGSTIRLEGLADSLDAIAREGAGLFYSGELARRIVAHVDAAGGPLTLQDMQAYEAIERPSLLCHAAGWDIACNPPPAVGGAVLAAMIRGFGDEVVEKWQQAHVERLVETQRQVLDIRRSELDLAEDRDAAANDLLRRSRNLLDTWTSAATVHTSAVDDDGLACAVTASAGYGSGEIPEGTGLWLNNCLGELELNRRGLSAAPPGDRLPSNMAPTVARRKDAVLSLGSPGADRITTALHQFIIHALQRGLGIEEAIRESRLHVDMSGDSDRLMLEPGIESESSLPQVRFAATGMYFGGVSAASWHPADGFQAASDPRREGGVLLPTG